MNTLEKDRAAGIWDKCEPPCLSLYQPTHRHHPDNQQDPIRFKNLVKALEKSLLQKFPKIAIQPLLAPFQALADDHDFWNHTLDGLAVLGARNIFRVYPLQRPVPELAVAADSFHTKPLMRILQSADRYQVLGLNSRDVKLFEGNRDALDEIEPEAGVPRTMTQALGEELTEPHQTVASYGGVGGGQAPMRHGHGGKKSEEKIDRERFFRAVDRGILEQHSKPSGLPLILAALPEHHHVFHKVSRNPHLMEKGIDIHPDALPSIDHLRQRAWQLIEPHYLARLAALVEEFAAAKAKDLAGDDPAKVAQAVMAGRVGKLLVEAGRVLPGRIQPATGDVEFGDLGHPELDDALDDLAELTIKKGGQVVIVPGERMPTDTGVAAIYRY